MLYQLAHAHFPLQTFHSAYVRKEYSRMLCLLLRPSTIESLMLLQVFFVRARDKNIKNNFLLIYSDSLKNVSLDFPVQASV